MVIEDGWGKGVEGGRGGGRHLAVLECVGSIAGSARNDLIRDIDRVVPDGQRCVRYFLGERHCGRRRSLQRRRAGKKGGCRSGTRGAAEHAQLKSWHRLTLPSSVALLLTRALGNGGTIALQKRCKRPGENTEGGGSWKEMRVARALASWQRKKLKVENCY
jgi:hypothetical protein